jgi:hypothetical protein
MTVYAFGVDALDPNTEKDAVHEVRVRVRVRLAHERAGSRPARNQAESFGSAFVTLEFGLQDMAVPATQPSYRGDWLAVLGGCSCLLTARVGIAHLPVT